ncbi:E3 SUMO-protein ligase nse2 [Ceratobasidium sp. AG-Ba]|nr:E3 SUMO-protein ligase nse2 [Ceratobasidium sp. AG-Ba]QRW06314.1 E3 SUMO-protein ligase nse2 [Ceratobasidium sp. AG-Ba]
MPPRRIKAERGARRQEPQEDAEMEPQRTQQEDEEARLERVLASIANYPDQPIESVQEDKIRILGSEARAYDQLYNQSLEAMVDTAVMLADALPGGEDPFENEEILKIKESLMELLDMQHISALHLDALDNDVRRPVGAGRQIIADYKSQTARQKYAKSKTFKAFVGGIWETGHSEAIPPTTQFLPREAGDPEDSDDDLEVGGVTQDYKCPLTLQIYVNPLTSTTCGHTFSAEGIREYLKNNDTCPGTGCNAKISMAVLKLDRGIQKKAIAAQRRAEKNAGSSDDSDIDED